MNALEKYAAKKKLAGRLGAGVGALLGGATGTVAGLGATGIPGGLRLTRAAGSGLGAALGASKGSRLRSGLVAALLGHSGKDIFNVTPALAAALVHGKNSSRLTSPLNRLGESRDVIGRDRGAVGRLKKKISDLLSGGKGDQT